MRASVGDGSIGEGDLPVSDLAGSGGDADVSEGIPVDTPSSSVADHAEPAPPRDTQRHPATPSQKKPATEPDSEPEAPRKKPASKPDASTLKA